MTSASIYQGQLARNLPPIIGEFLPGLETDAQRALQFVRSTPGVGTALVGMKQPVHVDENCPGERGAPARMGPVQEAVQRRLTGRPSRLGAGAKALENCRPVG